MVANNDAPTVVSDGVAAVSDGVAAVSDVAAPARPPKGKPQGDKRTIARERNQVCKFVISLSI